MPIIAIYAAGVPNVSAYALLEPSGLKDKGSNGLNPTPRGPICNEMENGLLIGYCSVSFSLPRFIQKKENASKTMP
jgi:hypothetical protein